MEIGWKTQHKEENTFLSADGQKHGEFIEYDAAVLLSAKLSDSI